MPKEGSNAFYRAYADRYYLDKANKDNYLYRSSASKIGLSGGLVIPDLETIDGVDLSVHAADIKAHQFGLQQIMVVGKYYTNLMTLGSTSTLTANCLYLVPFQLNRAITIDRVAIDVTTGIDGSACRLGLYADDGSGAPTGSPTKDAGAVATAIANAGICAATISPALSLSKGIFWLAAYPSAAITVRGSFPPVLSHRGFTSDLWLTNDGWYYTGTYGALPDPLPTPTGWLVQLIPQVAFRVASLV